VVVLGVKYSSTRLEPPPAWVRCRYPSTQARGYGVIDTFPCRGIRLQRRSTSLSLRPTHVRRHDKLSARATEAT
jgi:hypothetical protein